MRNQNKSMYNEKNDNKQSELDKEKIRNLYSIDITNKEDFINKINDIVNSNLSGYFEIINLDLSKLYSLIDGQLDYINVYLPILMSKSKIRKNFKDFDHDKHYHGMEANIFYDALIYLNDPELIIQNNMKLNEITIVTSVELYNKVTKENEKVTIAFNFNFEYKSKDGRKIINLIKTTFGMSLKNEGIYLSGGKPNNRKIIYKKRRGWLAPVAPSTSSNYSICKKDREVNENVDSNIDSTLKDDINKKQV